MLPRNPIRVIVIGGGITGLAAAWRIQRGFQESGSALNLQVLEGSPRLGGALQTTGREGFLLERGADCFISDKPRGIGLCKELGLEPEMIGTRPEFRRSFILRRNQFYPVPEGFYLMGPSRYRPFLESGLLSWPGKLRALLEPIIPSRPQTDESLASFVRRRFGQEMLDWMAQPLVAGIYGASPDELSLSATFPQFLEMERTYGSVIFGLKKQTGATQAASGARYSLFVTLRGGMQVLVDSLGKGLGAGVVRGNMRVKSITKSSFPAVADGPVHPWSSQSSGPSRQSKTSTGGRDGESITTDGPPTKTLGDDNLLDVWQVRLANGQVLLADLVCLALPSYAASDLLKTLDADLSEELASIAYAPAATVHFAFREMDVIRRLEGVGFVVPVKENHLILGCTLVQNKFEGRVPKGFLLFRAFLGGVRSASWIHENDENISSRVLAELKNWFGIRGSPLFTQIERYDRALPQYVVGHLPRILRTEERMFRHKGLALAGNWQYGVGIPDCIESGERAADALTAHLSRVAENAL